MQLIVHPIDQSTLKSALIKREIISSLGDVYACIADVSIGCDSTALIKACEGYARVVVRCGDPIRVNEHADDAARLLANWSQSGWTKFDEDIAFLDQMMQEHGQELLVRPSSEGMLSDAICTVSWARRAQTLGCKLFLDPMGWIVGSMFNDVEDHLDRIAELCSQCDNIGAILIRSVRTDESGKLVEVSLGEGEIDPNVIVDRLQGLIRSSEAVVVLDSTDLALLRL